MKKELLIQKRKKAKELHNNNWSIRKISCYLVSSKKSVAKWINLMIRKH